MFAAAGALARRAARLLPLLLLLLGYGSHGFVPPRRQRPLRPSSRVEDGAGALGGRPAAGLPPGGPARSSSAEQLGRRGMSYLDDLSPPSPEEEGGPEKDRRGGGFVGGPRRSAPRAPTGGIPSGRGPEGSYLEALAGGGGGGGSTEGGGRGSEDPPTFPTLADLTGASPSPAEKERPASWSGSGAYLAAGKGDGDGEPSFLSSGGGGGGAGGDGEHGKDDSRTDVRNLLTQRAIQSFMYLLEECRDPHSAKWIQEDFLGAGNLLDYHGTGAAFLERFGGTWDAPLLAMMDMPKTTMIVHAKRRGRGHGGWSKHNPYLPERWIRIPVSVDPVGLASRILSVREQIAREWVGDLDAVAEANEGILEGYFRGARADRDGGDGTGGGGDAAGGGAAATADRAFRRAAVAVLNERVEFTGGSPSPFRKGNFDLLYNLCTQAAIHRLLREDRAAGREREPSSLWLRDFYAERAARCFDGDGPYGRADDFLDEMLRTAPSIRAAPSPSSSSSGGDGGTTTGGQLLSDPVGTAERILRRRGEVAKEWRESLGFVPEEHNVCVRRTMLSKQVQGWEAAAAAEALSKPAASEGGGSEGEMGAFE